MSTEVTEYYDRLAKEYDSGRFGNSYGKFIDEQERAILDKRLKGVNPDRVLDMGCGTGRLLGYADSGIDASGAMLAEAQKKFPGKKLLQGDAARTPFEDAIFDAVISFHVLMHLDKEKTESLLTEASRVLKKGGRFIFDVPSRKRRKAVGYKAADWHGANAFAIRELRKSPGNWELKSYQGVLFLPIHRFPHRIRKPLFMLDQLLTRSFLREYSSYLVIELVKK